MKTPPHTDCLHCPEEKREIEKKRKREKKKKRKKEKKRRREKNSDLNMKTLPHTDCLYCPEGLLASLLYHFQIFYKIDFPPNILKLFRQY